MANMDRIKPRRLRIGDTIGVIAPASHGDPAMTAAGIEWLEQQGFHVALGKSVAQTYGYLAGDDAQRAADINEMFAAENVAGIICLRGGYGSPRLLDRLDYDVIRSHPKVFVGYSDITALHISISQHAGLITFHGPMAASDMAVGLPDYTRDYFYRAVASAEPIGDIIPPPLADEPVCIVPGIVEGCLTGGNLSLIAALMGTPYEIDTRGKILCLEEVGEEPYRIDRMLTQLRLAGKLQQAAGIVFDVCAGCQDEQDPDGDFTLAEVLLDRLGDLGKPVLSYVHFGHTPDKVTLPYGVRAQLESSAGRLIITETATCD